MKQCLQFGSWKRWGNTHCVCICIYIYTYGYIVHSRVLYSVSSVSYHIRKFRPLGLGGVEGWGDSGWVWGVGGLGLGVGVWGGVRVVCMSAYGLELLNGLYQCIIYLHTYIWILTGYKNRDSYRANKSCEYVGSFKPSPTAPKTGCPT